jgi:cobalt-zinc-cadmium efflux system membrane fusion protein
MSATSTSKPPGKWRVLARIRWIILVTLIVIAGVYYLTRPGAGPDLLADAPNEAKSSPGSFRPTASQWQSLEVRPVEDRPFRLELAAEGKIAVDEDHSTPIFSPYSGRVARILAKPGDMVKAGQLLFTIEATDMVQAQNDFITAAAGVETARAQLNLSEINEKRQHELYDGKAVPLKDWQQAQNDLIASQSNFRAAEIALEAVRNRLRLLQKSEDEIANFQKTGKINPETPIYAPIAGTVVQRKVGPGQYITSGASDPAGDPVYIIGDLGIVWLVANLRETDSPRVKTGQDLQFTVAAHGELTFRGKVDYVAEALDPLTRRLTVRANIENPDKLLKLEMFANVTILAGNDQTSPGIPREAIIYEGRDARVWVVTPDKSVVMRPVTLGLVNGNLVQVTSGLNSGENVITRGGLFIDRAASGNES